MVGSLPEKKTGAIPKQLRTEHVSRFQTCASGPLWLYVSVSPNTKQGTRVDPTSIAIFTKPFLWLKCSWISFGLEAIIILGTPPTVRMGVSPPPGLLGTVSNEERDAAILPTRSKHSRKSGSRNVP